MILFSLDNTPYGTQLKQKWCSVLLSSIASLSVFTSFIYFARILQGSN